MLLVAMASNLSIPVSAPGGMRIRQVTYDYGKISNHDNNRKWLLMDLTLGYQTADAKSRWSHTVWMIDGYSFCDPLVRREQKTSIALHSDIQLHQDATAAQQPFPEKLSMPMRDTIQNSSS